MANNLPFSEIASRLRTKGYRLERSGRHDIYLYQVESTSKNWMLPVGHHPGQTADSKLLGRMAFEAGLSIPQFRSFLECGRRGKPLKKCLDYECAASAAKQLPSPHPEPGKCPERFSKRCPVGACASALGLNNDRR